MLASKRVSPDLDNAVVFVAGKDPLEETGGGHSTLLRANIPIIEHMTNLGALPETGFVFHAVPVKVKNFGTFPVRAYAVVSF